MGDDLGSCTPTSSTSMFQPSQFPTLQSTVSQGPPPMYPEQPPAPNNLAVLGQLLAAIGTISQQAQQQQGSSVQPAFGNAFKPAVSGTDCHFLAPTAQ